MTLYRSILILCWFLGSCIPCLANSPTRLTAMAPMQSLAPTAVLWDLTTDTILWEKNPQQSTYPSSMQKILTIYILLEKLRQGALHLKDTLLVSQNAAKQEGSRMFLKPQESVTYEDILKGMIVASGNDACTALAESLCGSEALFAQQMNAKAKELGAVHSHFTNASGLPNPAQQSTCWDLALIAAKTIRNFPEEYARYYGLKHFCHNNVQQPSRNTLLQRGLADGMKTGKTDAGKMGIIVSSLRQGRRLLLVINGLATEIKRTAEASRLLNWGFSFFQPIFLFKAGQRVLTLPLWPGGTVSLITPRDIKVSLPRGARPSLRVVVKHYTPLLPPITKGQILGKLVLSSAQTAPLEFPLKAGETVEAPSFLEQVWYVIRAPFVSEKKS